MAPKGYEFDDDRRRVDVDAVWAFLHESAYWARWRPREIVEQQLAGAWRVVGCYAADGSTVGLARAVSDGCSMAYLSDVFVLEPHRGLGLGHGLLHAMIEDGPGSGFRWMLHTSDAHELYRDFGFAEPDDRFMERPGLTR